MQKHGGYIQVYLLNCLYQTIIPKSMRNVLPDESITAIERELATNPMVLIAKWTTPSNHHFSSVYISASLLSIPSHSDVLLDAMFSDWKHFEIVIHKCYAYLNYISLYIYIWILLPINFTWRFYFSTFLLKMLSKQKIYLSKIISAYLHLNNASIYKYFWCSPPMAFKSLIVTKSIQNIFTPDWFDQNASGCL